MFLREEAGGLSASLTLQLHGLASKSSPCGLFALRIRSGNQTVYSASGESGPTMRPT